MRINSIYAVLFYPFCVKIKEIVFYVSIKAISYI